MAIYCSHLHTNPCTHGENWCVSSLRKHPERRTFNQSSSTCLIFVLNNNGFNLILFLSSIRLETSPWSMSFQVKFLLRMKKKFTTQFFFFFSQEISLPLFTSLLLGDNLNLTDTLGSGWCLCTERLWRQENFYYLSRRCTHHDCSIWKLRLIASHYLLPPQRESDWYSKNIKANFSKSMRANIRHTEINTIALVLPSDSLGVLLVYLIWLNIETLCYSFVPNKTCHWSNLEALFSSFWVGKQFEHSAPHSDAEFSSISSLEMEKKNESFHEPLSSIQFSDIEHHSLS